MRVAVTVILEVEGADPDELNPDTVVKGDPLHGRILDSVANAVYNAVKFAEGDGHAHDMADELCVFVQSAEATEIVEGASACGS